MKILVLGGTGAIGSELVAFLGRHEHAIYVTSRRPRASSDSVHYIQGDAQDDCFLREILRNDWDVIVDFMVYKTATFRHRMDAFLGATGQYIFTSTARVFADSLQPLTERSPRLLDVSADTAYLATEEYALTKARQEDLLRASDRRHWTIIRPYITFGEGRLQLGSLEKENWLYRALQGRCIVFCDALLDKTTTLTDGADVARMIAVLVGNPAAYGEDYNLTGDRAITWLEVMTLYLDELEAHRGTRPRVVLQDLETFCGWAISVPQVKYDRMFERRFDPSKIGELFDLSTLTESQTALKDRLRDQLAVGAFMSIDWRAEALRDRATAQHARLREIRGAKPKLGYLVYRYLPLAIMKTLRPR